MPLGNKAVRPKEVSKNAHVSRERYLRSADTHPKICHLIAGERQQPWLTLVVGSGCATSKSQEDALFGMAARLKAHKSKGSALPSCIEGEPIGDAVAAFVTHLICDRLRLDTAGERVVPVTDGRVPAWLFELFAGAALSTRLYYRIKSLTFEAPRRPDRDDEAFLNEQSLSWELLDEELVSPCQALLQSLVGRVESIVEELAPGTPNDFIFWPDTLENLRETVRKILEAINAGLKPPENPSSARISLTDLRALTEFAWFCFTKVTAPRMYPGWSDLLLDLSNYDTPLVGSVGTPLFQTITGAQSLIKNRYSEITEESWRTICDQNGAREERHYLAAAQLLNAQHRYWGDFPDLSRPPLATAFVTSFDLELELSLLHLGEPFTVAVPIHVLNTVNRVAHTCWIALRVPGRVEGEDDFVRLRKLTEPADDCWAVLHEGLAEEGPVVTRLAGCPLIPLPKLPEDLAKLTSDSAAFSAKLIAFVYRFLAMDAKGDAGTLEYILENLELKHAVVINEHDALLQSAIDLISIPGGTEYEDGSDGGRRGLPTSFAAGNARWFRFWMMLGVQIHDSAVRNRISTVISSLPIPAEVGAAGVADDPGEDEEPGHAGSAGGRESPSEMVRNGVAVNKHLTALEQDLLFWNGFDIVRSDVAAFADDLKHYAAHLTPGTTARFARGNTCAIP